MHKITVFLLTALLTTGLLPARMAAASVPRQGTPPYTLFLPSVIQRSVTIYGIETNGLDETISQTFHEAGTTWTRRNAIVWSEVEPNKGVRNWHVLNSLEQDLIEAAQSEIEVVLIVRGAPLWARQFPSAQCGSILDSEVGAFASFMHEAVARYSKAPYNVKYWEIGNEPDVAHTDAEDQVFGCWGDYQKPYFDGGRYANMLKQVYPAIKSAAPNVQVLTGGLLLDCDPTNPPEVSPGVRKDCSPTTFFEGVLKNGGAPYFDGVAFHSYDYYWGGHIYFNPNWHSSWDTTGPALSAKVAYLRNLLASYGVQGKYLMATETALLCSGHCGQEFEETQANHLAHSYADSLRLGLKANIWYGWRIGWRNSDLTRPDGSVRPAYLAFKFSNRELSRAMFVRDLSYESVRGYEFRRGSQNIWFINSRTGAEQNFQLPGTPTAIYDVFGNPLPLTTNLTLNHSPVYIEW